MTNYRGVGYLLINICIKKRLKNLAVEEILDSLVSFEGKTLTRYSPIILLPSLSAALPSIWNLPCTKPSSVEAVRVEEAVRVIDERKPHNRLGITKDSGIDNLQGREKN